MPSGKIKLSIDNNSFKWRQRKLRGYLCSRFTNQKKKKRKTDQKSWENCISTKRVDKGSNVLRNPEKIIFRSRMAHVAGCLDCCGILSVFHGWWKSKFISVILFRGQWISNVVRKRWKVPKTIVSTNVQLHTIDLFKRL